MLSSPVIQTFLRSGKKNSARFRGKMLANEVERSNPPQYVAFRTMERWEVIPVIARIESREGGRLYGYWFSRFAPEGIFREVPLDHVVDRETTMPLRGSSI